MLWSGFLLPGAGWPGRCPRMPASQSPPPCPPSWTVKHQCVDLLAEGLWEELLDDEQPDITAMDWYVPAPRQVHTGAPPKHRPRPPPLCLSRPPGPSSALPPLRPFSLTLSGCEMCQAQGRPCLSDACLSQDDPSLSFRDQGHVAPTGSLPDQPRPGPDYPCWSLPPPLDWEPHRAGTGLCLGLLCSRCTVGREGAVRGAKW